ncbi:MAG: hypothetical protein PHX20_02795 [Candidatus Omnitrophica bacterium]|nr:hypothetical protein [Candidatus Omnitrophota bacterium]
MRYAKIIVMMIFLAAGIYILNAHATEAMRAREMMRSSAVAEVDESRYVRDTVPVDDTYAYEIGYGGACEVPVLLNKDTGKVEYYRSYAEDKWIIAGNQEEALQGLYDRRQDIRDERRLKGMQDEMNRRNRASMSERMQQRPAQR